MSMTIIMTLFVLKFTAAGPRKRFVVVVIILTIITIFLINGRTIFLTNNIIDGSDSI